MKIKDEESKPTTEAQGVPVMGPPFIENVGQFHPGTRFKARTSSGTLHLADNCLWLTIMEPERQDPKRPRVQFGREQLREPITEPRRGAHVRVSFVGSNPKPLLEGFDPQEACVSYLIGNDPKEWHAKVPVWGGVRYRDLYPRIDLQVSNAHGLLALRLVTRPGADLETVRLRIEGAEGVVLAPSAGGLRLITGAGELVLPLLTVEGEALRGPAVLPIAEGTLDVIGPFMPEAVFPGGEAPPTDMTPTSHASPGLIYSTYLGGTGEDWAFAVAADAAGAIYVTGSTRSDPFPTLPGAFSTTMLSDVDAFVAKFRPTPGGMLLKYSTYLGSRTGRESGLGIAVDNDGNAHVAGWTTGWDFPTTEDGFWRTFIRGSIQAFYVKFNAMGSALLYSTLLGGSGNTKAWAIALMRDGSAALTGTTDSDDFPVSVRDFPAISPAFQPARGGGARDAFVTRFDRDGRPVYSTYLGGSGEDVGLGIAFNSQGICCVTGYTASPDFPVGPSDGELVRRTLRGLINAFVARLNADGSRVYSTYLGGLNDTIGTAVAVGGDGSAYVTGYTDAPDFPTTPGAFRTRFLGGSFAPGGTEGTVLSGFDAFVAKISPTGDRLLYSTFLCGKDLAREVSDSGQGIQVDASGQAYVTGWTFSPGFPTTPDAVKGRCGTDGLCDFDGYNHHCDIFLVKLNAAGERLLYSTFLGGSGDDAAYALALDRESHVCLAGCTNSRRAFPVTSDAYQSEYSGGDHDAFVMKLELPP